MKRFTAIPNNDKKDNKKVMKKYCVVKTKKEEVEIEEVINKN